MGIRAPETTATSRAPKMLSMLSRFGIVGPKIDQIWEWLHRGYRFLGWGSGPPQKFGYESLFVGQILSWKKVSQKCRVNPPPLK